MNFPFITSKRSHLYIQVGKRYLKILQSQVTPKGPVVTKLLVEPIYALPEEDINRLLNDAVSSRETRFDSVTVIVSREKAMVRYMRLPAQDTSEIEKMVSFEITKQTPYSQDEITSDYEILSSDTEGYSEVMLVISPKNEITRIDHILGVLSNQLSQIRLSSEAVIGWLNIAEEEIRQGRNICLIDIDSDSTEIAIIFNGKLNFSRSISIGALDISEQKKEVYPSKARLVDEIKRSVEAYFKEGGKRLADISEFVVTGADSVIESFKDLLMAGVEMPCRAVNGLIGLSIEDGAMPAAGLPQDASMCTVCGGLFAAEGINLILQGQKKKQSKAVAIRKIINISVILLLISLAIFALIGMKMRQREKLLNELKLMYSQVESAANQTETKFKKLQSIKAQLSEEASSLNVIYNLYNIIPGNISLSDFNYDDASKVVRFRGRAGKISEVFKLVTLLENSASFSNVQTRSVAEKRTRGATAVDFQISCSFVSK